MVEAMRLQEHIFTGKTQIRALHEIVLITRVFQDIAQTDVLREEAGDRGGGVAFKGGKQRYAALRSHHARNRVIRSWQLLRVAEIQAFIFQRAQFRWGFYDDTVLDEAWKKFEELSRSGQRFSLFTLTVDTHHPDGFISRTCNRKKYDFDGKPNQSFSAVSCSQENIAAFINKIKASPWFKDTVIVVSSDHLAMNNTAWKYLNKQDRNNLFFVIRDDKPPKLSRGAKSASWKRSGAEYSLSGSGSTRLSETRVQHVDKTMWKGKTAFKDTVIDMARYKSNVDTLKIVDNDIRYKADSFIFNVAGAPEEVKQFSGISRPESWGRWSNAQLGDEVKIEYKHPLPKKFDLVITAKAYGNNASRPIPVRVGNEEQTLVLGNEVTTTTLHFDNPTDADTLVIVPPEPVSTNEGNILGHSPRKLGIGMVEIKVVEREG